MKKLLYAGVIGPLLFIVVFLIEGATRPGYSAWRNMVSQLATGDGGWVQVVNFLVWGTLAIVFAIGLREVLRGTRGSIAAPGLFVLYGAALLVAGIFPTDPALGYPPGAPEVHTTHGLIHGFSGLAVFVTLAAAAFVMSAHFATEPGARVWAIYSAAVGALILAFFSAGSHCQPSTPARCSVGCISASRSSPGGPGSPCWCFTSFGRMRWALDRALWADDLMSHPR
jgi:hypothetical membrane protein